MHYLGCLDACFTQKRRKNRGPYNDAAYINCDTVFLPKADVDNMEQYVDGIRGTGGAKAKEKGKGKEKELGGGDKDVEMEE